MKKFYEKTTVIDAIFGDLSQADCSILPDQQIENKSKNTKLYKVQVQKVS